jgi:hypothetical protein
MLIALARAMPTALSTSWSRALSYHRFCNRTRATSTRAGAQTSHALCTHSPAHSSAGETTDGCGRTTQPLGGDLASAALANAYYPESNRGVGLFLGNLLINTGQRAAANMAQEFILRRLTPKAKNQN